MDRLEKRPVACRIPHGKSHPLLPRHIKRNLEAIRAEGSAIGRGDDLPVDVLAVAPHQLRKFEREGPLDLGVQGATGPGSLDPQLLNNTSPLVTK